MSDIFNQNTVKGAVNQYFSPQGLQYDNLVLAANDLYKEVEPPVSTLEMGQVYEVLRKARVPVYKPREIQALVKVPADAVMTKHQQLVFPQVKMLNMPVGETGVIPVNHIRHKNYERTAKVLNALGFHTAELVNEQPGDAKLYLDFFFRFAQIKSTVIYSSGTLSGQIERLTQAFEVARGKHDYHANKSLKELGLNIQTCAVLLDETLPIGEYERRYPLTGLISELIFTKEEEAMVGVPSFVPPVNLTGQAGLPWQSRKKGEVSAEAVTSADAFLKLVSDELKDKILTTRGKSYIDTASTDQKLAAKAFDEAFASIMADEFWYLSCGVLFPKAERYDAATLDKKTRNIWSAPYVTHLIANQIAYDPMANALNVLNSKVKTPSLAKFTPTKGGLDQFIRELEEAESTCHYIYADNVYMYYPESDEWFSLDLVKGEANATREMAMAVGYYLLTRGWTGEDELPLYSNTWAMMAMVFVPTAVVESLALIGNMQVRNPGQGSGNAWTFLINHMVSTILVNKWKSIGRPKPGPDMVRHLSALTGIDFRIELVTPRFLEQIRSLKDEPIPFSDARKIRPSVKADLLGWDIVYTPEYGLVPVLNEDRLLKSVACPAPPGGSFPTPPHRVIHSYIQAFAHLVVGGWAHPALRRTLEEYTRNYWASMQHMITTGALSTGDAIKLIGSNIVRSQYTEFLELLDPDKPMHLQEWQDTIYSGVEREKRSSPNLHPDATTNRAEAFTSVTNPLLVRLGVNNMTPKERSTALLAQRRKGTLAPVVADRAQELLKMLSPTEYADEIARADKGLTNPKEYMTTLADHLKKVADKSAVARLWTDLITGVVNPGVSALSYGFREPVTIEDMGAMAKIPPPPGKGIVTPEIYTLVTQLEPTTTGTTIGWEDEEEYETLYGDYLKGAYNRKVLEDINTGLMSSYLGKMSVLIDSLREIHVPGNVHMLSAKDEGEARNPYPTFGIMPKSEYGMLARAEGYRVKMTNTQKRRAQRAKGNITTIAQKPPKAAPAEKPPSEGNPPTPPEVTAKEYPELTRPVPPPVRPL